MTGRLIPNEEFSGLKWRHDVCVCGLQSRCCFGSTSDIWP